MVEAPSSPDPQETIRPLARTHRQAPATAREKVLRGIATWASRRHRSREAWARFQAQCTRLWADRLPSVSGFTADRLPGAAAWRYVYLFIQAGSTMLLYVGLAHILSAEAFAAAATAQGVLLIAQVVGDFGLSQAAVTALPARVAASRGGSERLLGGAALAFVVAAGAALVLALISVVFLPSSVFWPVVLVAPAAALMVFVAGADGLLRGAGEFRRPVVFVAASRLGGFLALPVAALTGSASAACGALSVGTLIGSIGPVRLVARRARGAEVRAARDFAHASVPLGVSQVLILLGSRVNTLILAAGTSVTAAAVFDAAWRLYHVGHYAVGSLATAIAPFAADAIGARRARVLARLTWRTLLVMALGGAVLGAAVLVWREPLGQVLFDELGLRAAKAVVPLIVVLPLTLCGLVALATLSASDVDRRIVLMGYAIGSVLNLGLVVYLAERHGAYGAALAAAVGLAVTNAILLVAHFRLVRRVSAPAPSSSGAAGAADSGD